MRSFFVHNPTIDTWTEMYKTSQQKKKKNGEEKKRPQQQQWEIKTTGQTTFAIEKGKEPNTKKQRRRQNRMSITYSPPVCRSEYGKYVAKKKKKRKFN